MRTDAAGHDGPASLVDGHHTAVHDPARGCAGVGFTCGPERHFENPSTRLVVEFVAWPVTVGDEVVKTWGKVRTPAGMLQVLTPTQCIKDRLAAFYRWRDSQSLEQALLVGRAHRIAMGELARWSAAEGHEEDFAEFRRRLDRIRRRVDRD